MSVNQELADAFNRMAQLVEITGGDRFRAIAHGKAARAVEVYPGDIRGIACDKNALTAIEGIGPKIADKITEFCQTGRLRELEELQAQVPAGLLPLMGIQGLGPKTLNVLWKQGGVTDLESLKRIIADGSILGLDRMGAKTVANMKLAIETAEQGSARLPLGIALPIAELIVSKLEGIKGVKRVSYAGSLRRGRDTVGDIDLIAACKDPDCAAAVSEAFRTMPWVERVLAAGETKSSVLVRRPGGAGRLAGGGDATVQVDLRVVPPERYGAALHYFTGSKEHNIRMRQRALERGLTLNDWGLFEETDAQRKSGVPPQERGAEPVAAKTEREIFDRLGLPLIPPELREDRGEFDLPMTPSLIEIDDIKAELHAHTTASDGRLSIEQLAEAAKARGFHTVAVTDHSKSSAIAGGLSPERLLEHIAAVRAANDRVDGIEILAGSEVDILADGSLDYDDALLAQLDVVVASPHAALTQEPAAATERLVRAARHPMVHIMGHPTGRLVDRRPGLAPDMKRLIEACVESNTALEINAHWLRLDLRAEHVRMAVEMGALIAIDCDVHTTDDFDSLRYGVTTGRRGWLPPERCVNTWSAKKLREWLRSKR